MQKSISERHSLPAMSGIPRSGPAKANDIRFATLRGRNQIPPPLKTVPEFLAKGVTGILGDPVKNPTVSARPNNFVTDIHSRSLLGLPSLNYQHAWKSYPENIFVGTRLGYDSQKRAETNSPQTTHEVALQSYKVARHNGAKHVWEWGPTLRGPKPASSSTGVQIPVDYDQDAYYPSTINLGPVPQIALHNTTYPGNLLNLPPDSSQAVPSDYTDPTTAHDITRPKTPYRNPSRPATGLSQYPGGISPFLGSRSATSSTFRLKSLVKKTSQFFRMSNTSRSTTALNTSTGAVIIEVNQPKQGHEEKKKAKKNWKTQDDVKIVMVQTQAQMFLEIARKAERKGKTVYFASTTGSTFVLTNDSCAGAYTAIRLSTAHLAGQIAPSLMGTAELPPVDGSKGRKGLLFLLSPQQIMGLLPFEKVDVEKEGKSEMYGFGVKTKLGQQYYEHEWQDGKNRRFMLTLHLAMVIVRGPGQLVGEISAVFWA